MKKKLPKSKYQILKTQDGITLIALIVIIVILLILTGVGINAGIYQMNNIKLKAFYSKLEVAQEAIEKIADTNEYDENWGTAPTAEQISLITSISENYDTTKFRYFTKSEVESTLNVSGVDMNLLIDFDNKLVISADGEEVDGTVYYTLQNDKYTVEYVDKNTGNVDFNCTVKSYGLNAYKITVTPVNIGDLKEGVVKYRYSNRNDYWKIAKNNEIIVDKLTIYDIMYTDANNNSITKSITIEKDENENVVIAE